MQREPNWVPIRWVASGPRQEVLDLLVGQGWRMERSFPILAPLRHALPNVGPERFDPRIGASGIAHSGGDGTLAPAFVGLIDDPPFDDIVGGADLAGGVQVIEPRPHDPRQAGRSMERDRGLVEPGIE